MARHILSYLHVYYRENSYPIMVQIAKTDIRFKVREVELVDRFFCVVVVVALLFYVHGKPGRVAQSVGHLTRKSGVLGSIPGLATYFRFSFRFFKKGSCQLLAKVCARSTG